jgi:hypothetical protein
MAVTCTLSNHFKYQAYKKQLDLSADSIKVLLARSGFVFNKDDHAKKINIKASISRSDISFESGSKHIHTVAGTFITSGLVATGKVTIGGTASNNGVKTIVSVDSETQMTMSEALTDEGAGAAMTITGADELATGSGYTQDTKVLTGVALAEDDTNDRAEMTCNNIIWTASGGSIGPTPGAILYDDTSSDDSIIGYIDFDGAQTAPDGADFTISNLKIRLS